MLRLAASALFLLVAGCSHASTVTPPEFPDGRNAANDPSASVPTTGLDLRAHPEPKCDRDVRVIDDDHLAEGYQLVSETTVSCPPGEVRRGGMYSCEDRLRERACAVGADVVLVKAHDRSAASVTARLVRLPK